MLKPNYQSNTIFYHLLPLVGYCICMCQTYDTKMMNTLGKKYKCFMYILFHGVDPLLNSPSQFSISIMPLNQACRILDISEILVIIKIMFRFVFILIFENPSSIFKGVLN